MKLKQRHKGGPNNPWNHCIDFEGPSDDTEDAVQLLGGSTSRLFIIHSHAKTLVISEFSNTHEMSFCIEPDSLLIWPAQHPTGISSMNQKQNSLSAVQCQDPQLVDADYDGEGDFGFDKLLSIH